MAKIIPPELKIPMAIGLTIAIILILNYTGTAIGLESDVTTDFVMIMPGLFLFAVAAVVVVSIGKSIYALPAFTVAGITLALLFEYMYDQSLISSQIMSGMSVGDVQLILIVFGFLMGSVVAAMGSK